MDDLGGHLELFQYSPAVKIFRRMVHAELGQCDVIQADATRRQPHFLDETLLVDGRRFHRAKRHLATKDDDRPRGLERSSMTSQVPASLSAKTASVSTTAIGTTKT